MKAANAKLACRSPTVKPIVQERGKHISGQGTYRPPGHDVARPMSVGNDAAHSGNGRDPNHENARRQIGDAAAVERQVLMVNAGEASRRGRGRGVPAVKALEIAVSAT